MGQSGTGWLWDQLAGHPDFWMPPIKEIRYLDREVPKFRGAPRRLQHGSRRTGQKGSRRRLESRDRQFLETAAALGGQPMDIRHYATMFGMKDGRLTGDVTPAYVTLSENTIEQIATHLPQAKILLLVRDPVSRVWSGISKADRAGNFDRSLLDDPERFRTVVLENPRKLEKRSPTRPIERWARTAPKVQFRHFIFDDLVRRPDWLRREILTYLGADPEKPSGTLAAGYNRKASRAKLDLTPPIQAVLVEHFRDELHACAKVFGGAAEEWPVRYGL